MEEIKLQISPKKLVKDVHSSYITLPKFVRAVTEVKCGDERLTYHYGVPIHKLSLLGLPESPAEDFIISVMYNN